MTSCHFSISKELIFNILRSLLIFGLFFSVTKSLSASDYTTLSAHDSIGQFTVEEILRHETGTVPTKTIIRPKQPSLADTIAYVEARQSGYIKTNMPQWLLLQANFAVEFDVAPHWSVALPISYCGMDWTTYKYKFRVFSLLPGARYWTRRQNQGWFIGAHLGMGWFDFAFGGQYRYQDEGRHTPALGGGLSFGYRQAIADDGHWWFEAELGLGVYRLSYDRFINVKGGAYIDTQRRVRLLPDIISLTIAYRFDLRKGGKKW